MEENLPKKPFDLATFRLPAPRPQGPTAEQLAESLGPFSPPDDYDFGDEFAPDVPRPIPRRNWQGSNASRRRSKPVILIVLGIAFVVFRLLPSIENLGNYILPLWYLDWAGVLLFVWGIGAAIRNQFALDDFNYIRDGIPAVGRVIHLHRGEIPQIMNGQVIGTVCSFQTLIEFINPQREQREFLFFQTPTFPLNQVDRYEAGFAVGDYITLVSLPGDFASNLRIYAWTGLSPDDDWPKRDGKPLRGTTPLKALLITKSVLLGLWLLVGFLHLILYFPDDWSWKWGGIFLGFGLVLGIGTAFYFGWRQSLKPPFPEVTPPSLRGMILTGTICGLLCGLFAKFLVNSLLDRAVPVPRSVEITQYWETTHSFLIRTYEVEIRPVRGGTEKKKPISYPNLAELQMAGSKYGVELVMPGWLGLPWVDGVRPIHWRLASDPPVEAEKNQIVRLKSLTDGKVYSLIPYIQVNPSLTLPPPPDLIPLAVQELVQQHQMQIEK